MSDAEVVLQFQPDHLAERLRIRKGQTVRYSRLGIHGPEVTDFRVTKVSMPDRFGRCTVSVEAAR